mmetsp:Transcript_17800/g.29426  ORF Transcript_17800/g.29426 Transcript_17800/m.29426 type:complete len:106 (+) Transcript_17800:2015-2332(+)
MILPGLYAILSPLAVGFLIGPRCLVGLLAGAISSGMMLALMMANAGGAWDNSKKYVPIPQHQFCIAVITNSAAGGVLPRHASIFSRPLIFEFLTIFLCLFYDQVH